MVETREVRGVPAVNIIGTGLSGLVGSRVVELLEPEFQFENLSLETGFDITHQDAVMDRITQSHASWVFHFAATTDLDGAEQERQHGEKSTVWRVNVEGTRHVVQAAQARNKRVLYLSTDFVFDGRNEPYTEESIPNPLSWYAVTKYEGEKLVASMGKHGLIMRIAFPYKAGSVGREDFVHRLIHRLQRGEQVDAPKDQLFMPTFIDDIARVIQTLVSKQAWGVYHAVGSEAISPYGAAVLIAGVNGLDESKVVPTTYISYYKDRAPRPFHAVLKNDKIEALGIRTVPFSEGVRLVRDA